jgi:hypothetical protein
MRPMSPFRFACVAATFSIVVACGAEAPETGESTSSSTSGPPQPIPCNVDQLCPDPEQVCLVDQCSAGGIPELTIVSPANEGKADWTPGGATTMLSVTIEVDNFQIVDPAIDPTSVRGAGQVVLTLDGVEVMTIQEGDAGAGVTVMVPADATPGGHRLAAHLILSDGTPYDNEEAAKRRFFWFDDGQPRVSVMSPWPGDEFTTGEQPVETRVAVVNFELQPATVDAVPGAVGIVHTFIDADFPTCGEDPECAADYTNTIAPPNPDTWALQAVLIPNAQVDETTNLIVQLARTDHIPYCGEVGPATCNAIWDSVELTRIAPTD